MNSESSSIKKKQTNKYIKKVLNVQRVRELLKLRGIDMDVSSEGLRRSETWLISFRRRPFARNVTISSQCREFHHSVGFLHVVQLQPTQHVHSTNISIYIYIYIYCISVVLNLVGGTEPRKFHPCIHRTLRNWKTERTHTQCVGVLTSAEPLTLTHRTQVKNH